MKKQKHQPVRYTKPINKAWIVVVLLLTTLAACNDYKDNKVNMPYSNIDSITVIKRDEGQSWEYAYRFTIKDTVFFSSVYRDYINKGNRIRNYYASLPLNKYDFKTYRSDGRNDTFVLYHDYVQLSGVGVIHLPDSLEQVFDEAFTKDSLHFAKSH